MRSALEQQYEAIFDKYHLQEPIDGKRITEVIAAALKSFLKDKQTPAIYCSGGHTRMLMADFMFELKHVQYIIDNYAKADDGGFQYLKNEEIEAKGIDGIVISTRKFRNDVLKNLTEEHQGIPFLDIYEELAKNGIHIESDYYYANHPYHHYHKINTLRSRLAQTTDKEEQCNIYREIVTKYLHIKDFLNALKIARNWNALAKDAKTYELTKDIERLYQLELEAAEQIAAENVLMLCVDGLRRCDLLGGGMPCLEKHLRGQAYVFENAYSFSTSTFESLIPVYSENGNLKTGYFNQNVIDEQYCRFIREAKAQNRKMFFYTDMEHYVESPDICYAGGFQAASEKIWNFIIDAVEEENGLFYMHVLYESHYSFSNPYTEEKLLSEGSAMLFDYLPQKGGKLRADYEQQHKDAMQYLDDVMTPFIERMGCKMLIYADHGNLVLPKDCKEEDVPETKLTFDEEWIQIPMVVKSPYMGRGVSHNLMSLMSLNDIVVALLNNEKCEDKERSYIKVARSELYNPDFRFLYKRLGKESYLQAFETFIFSNHRKLAIYADGTVELYDAADDRKIDNPAEIKELLERIRDEITVCDACSIAL